MIKTLHEIWPFVLGAVCLAFIVVIAASGIIDENIKQEREDAMKMEMIKQGYSAEEISTVFPEVLSGIRIKIGSGEEDED